MKKKMKFKGPRYAEGGTPEDEQSFGQAFKAGRKAMLAGGDKTFMYKGKSYGTSLAGDNKTKSTSPSTPKMREKDSNSKNPKTPVISKEEGESTGTRIKEGAIGTLEQLLKTTGTPLQIRTFLSTLLGSTRNITEKNLTADELATLKADVDKQRAAGKTSLDYGRGKEKLDDLNNPGQYDSKNANALTFGRAAFEDLGRGKNRLTDTYDFSNEVRDKEVARVEKIKKEEGNFGLLKDLGKSFIRNVKTKGIEKAVNTLPSDVGNSFIGRNGRKVDIKLAKGGSVKSSASSRGDGIAQRGKTRGRNC